MNKFVLSKIFEDSFPEVRKMEVKEEYDPTILCEEANEEKKFPTK